MSVDRPFPLIVAALATAALLTAGVSAPAATWTGGTATWDNADGSNWNTTNPPGDQDNVNLTQTSSGDLTITYAAPVPTDGGDSNTIGAYAGFELTNTGSGRTTLEIGSGDTLKAASENHIDMIVGDGGTIDQTGGTVDYSVGTLKVNAGGRYELSGGTITSSGGATQDIQLRGGTYIQDGGSAEPGDRFMVFSGASATFSPGATVDPNAQYVQRGGTVTHDGGTLNASSFNFRSGAYTFNGGDVQIASDANIANNRSTDATLTVNGADFDPQDYVMGGGTGTGKLVLNSGSATGRDFNTGSNAVVEISGGEFNVGHGRFSDSTGQTVRVLGGGASTIHFGEYESGSLDLLEYRIGTDGLDPLIFNRVDRNGTGLDATIDMGTESGVTVASNAVFDLVVLDSVTFNDFDGATHEYALASEDQSDWNLQIVSNDTGGETLQATYVIPEPATLALLAPTGLLLLRRRRRR